MFSAIGRCNAVGGQPDYHCLVPEGASVNDTIPRTEYGALVKCEMYERPGSNVTTKCSDYHYYGDIGHNIVSEVIDSVREFYVFLLFSDFK